MALQQNKPRLRSWATRSCSGAYIATTVQKYENATISHLVAKVFLYQATESIEAFAEVGMAMEPKILGVSIDV